MADLTDIQFPSAAAIEVDAKDTETLRKYLSQLQAKLSAIQQYYESIKGHSYLRDRQIKTIVAEIAEVEAQLVQAQRIPAWKEEIFKRRKQLQSDSTRKTSNTETVAAVKNIISVIKCLKSASQCMYRFYNNKGPRPLPAVSLSPNNIATGNRHPLHKSGKSMASSGRGDQSFNSPISPWVPPPEQDPDLSGDYDAAKGFGDDLTVLGPDDVKFIQLLVCSLQDSAITAAVLTDSQCPLQLVKPILDSSVPEVISAIDDTDAAILLYRCIHLHDFHTLQFLCDLLGHKTIFRAFAVSGSELITDLTSVHQPRRQSIYYRKASLNFSQTAAERMAALNAAARAHYPLPISKGIDNSPFKYAIRSLYFGFLRPIEEIYASDILRIRPLADDAEVACEGTASVPVIRNAKYSEIKEIIDKLLHINENFASSVPQLPPRAFHIPLHLMHLHRLAQAKKILQDDFTNIEPSPLLDIMVENNQDPIRTNVDLNRSIIESMYNIDRTMRSLASEHNSLQLKHQHPRSDNFLMNPSELLLASHFCSANERLAVNFTRGPSPLSRTASDFSKKAIHSFESSATPFNTTITSLTDTNTAADSNRVQTSDLADAVLEEVDRKRISVYSVTDEKLLVELFESPRMKVIIINAYQSLNEDKNRSSLEKFLISDQVVKKNVQISENGLEVQITPVNKELLDAPPEETITIAEGDILRPTKPSGKPSTKGPRSPSITLRKASVTGIDNSENPTAPDMPRPAEQVLIQCDTPVILGRKHFRVSIPTELIMYSRDLKTSDKTHVVRVGWALSHTTPSAPPSVALGDDAYGYSIALVPIETLARWIEAKLPEEHKRFTRAPLTIRQRKKQPRQPPPSEIALEVVSQCPLNAPFQKASRTSSEEITSINPMASSLTLFNPKQDEITRLSQSSAAMSESVEELNCNSPVVNSFQQQARLSLSLASPTSIKAFLDSMNHGETTSSWKFVVLKYRNGVFQHYHTDPVCIIEIPQTQKCVEVCCGIDLESNTASFQIEDKYLGTGFVDLFSCSGKEGFQGYHAAATYPIPLVPTSKQTKRAISSAFLLSANQLFERETTDRLVAGAFKQATTLAVNTDTVDPLLPDESLKTELSNDTRRRFKCSSWYVENHYSGIGSDEKLLYALSLFKSFSARVQNLIDGIVTETSLQGQLFALKAQLQILMEANIRPLLCELETISSHRIPVVPDIDSILEEQTNEDSTETARRNFLANSPIVCNIKLLRENGHIDSSEDALDEIWLHQQGSMLLANNNTAGPLKYFLHGHVEDILIAISELNSTFISQCSPSARAALATFRNRSLKAPPLCAALHLNQLDYVRILTQHEPVPNVNLPDEQGNTPLILATLKGLPSLVKLFLFDMNASASPINYQGYNVLHIALLCGQSECLSILLSHPTAIDEGVINAQTPYKSNCVLLATKLQMKEYLVEFLKRGGNPSKCDAGNVNALVYSLKYGVRSDLTVEILKFKHLFSSTEINVRERRGEKATALLLAASNGLTHVCRTLLALGASVVTTFDHNKCNALHAAIISENDDCAELILKQAIKHNEERFKDTTLNTSQVSLATFLAATDGKFGMSALHLACDRCLPKTVQLLLSVKADINAQAKNGQTPLMLSALSSNEELACTIVNKAQKYINLSVVDRTGSTVLMYAAQKGYTKLLTILIDQCRAEINTVSNSGHTALTTAIQHSQTTCAETILQLGGQRVELAKAHGAIDIPVEYAFQKGLYPLAKLLVSLTPQGVISSTLMDKINKASMGDLKIQRVIAIGDTQPDGLKRYTRLYYSDGSMPKGQPIVSQGEHCLSVWLQHKLGICSHHSGASDSNKVSLTPTVSEEVILRKSSKLQENLVNVLLDSVPTGMDAISILEKLECTNSSSDLSPLTTPTTTTLETEEVPSENSLAHYNMESDQGTDILLPSMSEDALFDKISKLFRTINPSINSKKSVRVAISTTLRTLKTALEVTMSTAFNPFCSNSYEWKLPRAEAVCFQMLLSSITCNPLTDRRREKYISETLERVINEAGSRFFCNSTTRSKWPGRNISLCHAALFAKNEQMFKLFLQLGANPCLNINPHPAPLCSWKFVHPAIEPPVERREVCDPTSIHIPCVAACVLLLYRNVADASFLQALQEVDQVPDTVLVQTSLSKPLLAYVSKFLGHSIPNPTNISTLNKTTIIHLALINTCISVTVTKQLWDLISLKCPNLHNIPDELFKLTPFQLCILLNRNSLFRYTLSTQYVDASAHNVFSLEEGNEHNICTIGQVALAFAPSLLIPLVQQGFLESEVRTIVTAKKLLALLLEKMLLFDQSRSHDLMLMEEGVDEFRIDTLKTLLNVRRLRQLDVTLDYFSSHALECISDMVIGKILTGENIISICSEPIFAHLPNIETSTLTFLHAICQVGSLVLIERLCVSSIAFKQQDNFYDLLVRNELAKASPLMCLLSPTRSFGPQAFSALSKLYDVQPNNKKASFLEELASSAHLSVTAKLAATLPWNAYALTTNITNEVKSRNLSKHTQNVRETATGSKSEEAGSIIWCALVFTATVDQHRQRPTFKKVNLRTPFLLLCPPHVVATLSQIAGKIQTHNVSHELIKAEELTIPQNVSNILRGHRKTTSKPPPRPLPSFIATFKSHPQHDGIYHSISTIENTWRGIVPQELFPITIREQHKTVVLEEKKTRKRTKVSSQSISFDTLIYKLFAVIAESCASTTTAGAEDLINIDDVCIGYDLPFAFSEWMHSIVAFQSRCGMTDGILFVRHGIQYGHVESDVFPSLDYHKSNLAISRTLCTKHAIMSACSYRRHEVLWLLLPDTRFSLLNDSGSILTDVTLEDDLGATGLNASAATIKILLQARSSISPTVIEFAKAHPDLLGINYITPVQGDTFLHIAAMNDREDVAEMLLSDQQFHVGLATNLFGNRAWDYCKNPGFLDAILKGSVAIANRLFKSKEMLSVNAAARFVIEKKRLDALVDKSTSVSMAEKLHRLQNELKRASNPYLYDFGHKPFTDGSFSGPVDIIESVIREILQDDPEIQQEIIESIKHEVIYHDESDNFNTLSLSDNNGIRLVTFDVALVSVRYAMESIETTNLASFLQTLLEGNNYPTREGFIFEEDKIESGIPPQAIKILRDLGLIVELEDAFGSRGFQVEKAVIARIAIPQTLLSQILMDALKRQNDPNCLITSQQKMAFNALLVQKKNHPELRFTFDWELINVPATQRSKILNMFVTDALEGIATVRDLSEILSGEKPAVKELEQDSKSQNVALTPLYNIQPRYEVEGQTTIEALQNKFLQFGVGIK